MLRYFRTISFKRDHLRFNNTGAIIKYDSEFLFQIRKLTPFNLYILALRFWRFITRQKSVGKLAFYPQTAGPWYNAWFAAHFAGCKVIRDIDAADYIFVFEDLTHSDLSDRLTKDQQAKAINLNVRDISKQKVGEIFEQVFGYPVAVDPLTYQGLAARKSDENGTHDGVIVKCPIRKDDVQSECVYQKLIDTVYDGKRTEDLRIIFTLGEIPLVFHKYKDPDARFGMDYLVVDLEDPKDHFSDQETANIIEFCQTIGLDFGAVDILRDRNDGKIYIVDVNKTCMPVIMLKLRVQINAFSRVGQSFRNGLIRMFNLDR